MIRKQFNECKGIISGMTIVTAGLIHMDQSLSVLLGKTILTNRQEKLLPLLKTAASCVHKHYDNKLDPKLSECREFAESGNAVEFDKCLGELNTAITDSLNSSEL